MAATHGEGAYGNATGVTTPTEHKMAQTTEFVKTTSLNVIRPGVLYNGITDIVAGKANMSYDVYAFSIATQRSATAGVMKWANNGTLNIATDMAGSPIAAPGSNSAYHVVFAWHREYALDGTDSSPIIGVLQGTSGPSPTVPSLASYPGAVELARILVPAGVTATNSGTTITQTAPFTASDGARVPFRTKTEMDLWTTALADQRATDLTTGVIYRRTGSTWKAWESDWIAYTSTTTNLTVGTGGSALKSTKYRYVEGEVEHDVTFVLGTSGASIGNSPSFTTGVTLAAVKHANVIYFGKGSVILSGASGSPYGAVIHATGTSATTVTIGPESGTGAQGAFTASSPFTFTAGSVLQARFIGTPA